MYLLIKNLKVCTDIYTADGALLAQRGESLTHKAIEQLWPNGQLSGMITLLRIQQKEETSTYAQ